MSRFGAGQRSKMGRCNSKHCGACQERAVHDAKSGSGRDAKPSGACQERFVQDAKSDSRCDAKPCGACQARVVQDAMYCIKCYTCQLVAPQGVHPTRDVSAFSVNDDGNFLAKIGEASFNLGSRANSDFLIIRKGPKDWNPAGGSYFVIWRECLLTPEEMWNYAHTEGRVHFENLDAFEGLGDEAKKFIPHVRYVGPFERPLTVKYDGEVKDTQGPRKGPYYVLQFGFHYGGKKGMTAPKDLYCGNGFYWKQEAAFLGTGMYVKSVPVPCGGNRGGNGSAPMNSRCRGEESWLAEVKKNGMSLEFCSAASRDIVLAAVQQNGLALKYAPDSLKASKEVVLAAVKKNGLALEFSGPAMAADVEVGQAAVMQNPEASRYVEPATLVHLICSVFSDKPEIISQLTLVWK